MKGEVKHKLSLDRPARENGGRAALFRIHRRIAITDQVRLEPDRRLLTGSLFKERKLAAEAVGTVENSERVFCGEFSKRGGNGGKPAFWVFHGFHGAAVSTAFVRAPQTRLAIESLSISRNYVVTCQRRPS